MVKSKKVKELQEFREKNLACYLSAVEKLDKRSSIVVSWLMAGKTASEVGKVVKVSAPRVLQIFSALSRKITHSLLAQEAEESFKRLIREESRGSLDEVLAQRWEVFPLTVRTQNCLRAIGAVTIRDLVAKTEVELLELPNLGRKSLMELRSAVEALGLYLGMPLPPTS